MAMVSPKGFSLSALVAVTLFATAIGYLLGVSASKLQDTKNPPSDFNQPDYPENTQAIHDSEGTAEPEYHSKELTAAESISRISKWIQSSDGIAQQFPLYDTIAQTSLSAFPEVALALINTAIPAFGEAREVLILRWRTDDPEGLLRFHHAFKESYPRCVYYDTDFVIHQLAKQNLRETIALLEELESNGENLTNK